MLEYSIDDQANYGLMNKTYGVLPKGSFILVLSYYIRMFHCTRNITETGIKHLNQLMSKAQINQINNINLLNLFDSRQKSEGDFTLDALISNVTIKSYLINGPSANQKSFEKDAKLRRRKLILVHQYSPHCVQRRIRKINLNKINDEMGNEQVL